MKTKEALVLVQSEETVSYLEMLANAVADGLWNFAASGYAKNHLLFSTARLE